MDANVPDRDNFNLIRNKEIKSVANRCQKLDKLLKKGVATVYDQCSREVKEKLENTQDWETIQKEQCRHVLIQKIKQIYVGFDDHKQDVYNLVQALKGLILYSQLVKELV